MAKKLILSLFSQLSLNLKWLTFWKSIATGRILNLLHNSGIEIRTSENPVQIAPVSWYRGATLHPRARPIPTNANSAAGTDAIAGCWHAMRSKIFIAPARSTNLVHSGDFFIRKNPDSRGCAWRNRENTRSSTKFNETEMNWFFGFAGSSLGGWNSTGSVDASPSDRIK
jgi:hypothetical protein